MLDLGIILAIPSCGRTLAEFGADVIKIDSPHRNPVPWHNDVNRAKRSILLDLKSEEGREIFWRLLEDADVVLENFRTGVADKLGIGYEAVRARRPDIVYCSVNAYGQTKDYAERPGREVLVQALTGMQTRYGGEKPAQNPINANDYATGLGACLGVALALLHRRRTGQGQYVNSALIYGATLMQSSLLQAYEGKQWDEPGGLDCLGRGPLYRAYRASDDWVFMAALAQDLPGCPALSDLAGLRGAELERALEARFRTRSVDEWVKLLPEAGIAAQRVVLRFEDLMEDPVVIRQGLSLTRLNENQGMVTTTGPGIRPVPHADVAGTPGADAGNRCREHPGRNRPGRRAGAARRAGRGGHRRRRAGRSVVVHPGRYVLAATLACVAVAAVHAQAYPVKPVRMVVPFAPGGGTDVIARYLAAGMSESMGRQVVVDNRGGANGIIGTEIVARAPADGYTLLFVSSPHSVNPSLYPKLPYDTLRDFAPVSMVALVTLCPGDPSVAARAQRERAHRAGEGAARPDQLWLRRQRQLGATRGRAVQPDGGREAARDPVQGRGTGAAGGAVRRELGGVRQRADGEAPHPERPAACARHRERKALGVRAGDADDRRSRRARLSCGRGAGTARARAYAAGDHRHAQRRDAQDRCASRARSTRCAAWAWTSRSARRKNSDA